MGRHDGDYYEITIGTTTDGRATLACAELATDSGIIHAHGSSRRVNGDKYSKELGDLLAIERAVQDVVHQLRHRNQRLIKALEKPES